MIYILFWFIKSCYLYLQTFSFHIKTKYKKRHEKLDLYSHFESLKTMLYPEYASLDIITQNEQAGTVAAGNENKKLCTQFYISID